MQASGNGVQKQDAGEGGASLGCEGAWGREAGLPAHTVSPLLTLVAATWGAPEHLLPATAAWAACVCSGLPAFLQPLPSQGPPLLLLPPVTLPRHDPQQSSCGFDSILAPASLVTHSDSPLMAQSQQLLVTPPSQLPSTPSSRPHHRRAPEPSDPPRAAQHLLISQGPCLVVG